MTRGLAKTKRFPALVRGEDGGLDVRMFATPEDAAAAAQAREVKPEPLVQQAVGCLPELLAQMLVAQVDRVNIRPTEEGGLQIDLVQRNQLYVSRAELADMLPRFGENSDPKRFLDALIAAGLPYADPTGTKIFNVQKCVDWIERRFGHGGE